MYTFIDTVEAPSVIPALGTEAVNINGVWLEELIPEYKTLNVTGREALEVEISDQEIAGRDGSVYRTSNIRPRTLEITYRMKCSDALSFRAAYNTLLAYLTNKELTLIFNDEPEYKWKGRLISIGQPVPGETIVRGSFAVYCLDPYKHAVEPYEIDLLGTQFTFAGDTVVTDGDVSYELFENFAGLKRIASDMAGTYPVIRMNVRTRGSKIDCKYLTMPEVAILSQDKIPAEWASMFTAQNLEYWMLGRSAVVTEGSASAVLPSSFSAPLETLFTIGGDAVSETVTLFNVTDAGEMTTANGWKANDGIFNFNLNGTDQQGYINSSGRVRASSWGTARSGWYGPSMTYVLADPKLSGTFSFKTTIHATAKAQTGAIRFSMSGMMNGRRSLICDLSFYKTSTANLTGGVRAFVNGKTMHEVSVDMSANNPYGAQSGCENSITKKGSTITVSYAGQSYTFEDEELADVKISEVGLWFNRTGRYGDTPMAGCGAYDLKLVVSDSSSGNTFEFIEGDEVVLDFGTGDLEVNGNLRNDIIIDMADWADVAKVSTLYITPVGGGVVEHTEGGDNGVAAASYIATASVEADLEGIDGDDVVSTDCLMDAAAIEFDEARL